MKPNVGTYEAAVRFVGGCGLLALANHGHAWAGIGLVPVATAAVGFCPLSWALGRDSAAKECGDAAVLADGDRGTDPDGDSCWRGVDPDR